MPRKKTLNGFGDPVFSRAECRKFNRAFDTYLTKCGQHVGSFRENIRADHKLNQVIRGAQQ